MTSPSVSNAEPLALPGDELADRPPRRWELLAAGGVLALLYLASVNGRWWPTQDSALHLSLARSIAEGRGFEFNGQPSTRVSPGFPLILAGLRATFGAGFWPGNILAALCGLAALALAYLTLGRLGSRRIALAATLATGLSYAFFFTSHRILTDAPFALLFWAAVYSAARWRTGGPGWLAGAFALALAGVTVRAPGVVLLGPAAVGLALDRSARSSVRRNILAAGAMLAGMAIAGASLLLLARTVTETTPAYVAVVARRTVGERLGELAVSAARVPRVLAEMLTGQEGLAVPFGIPMVLLILAASWVAWGRGRRFLPTAVIGGVACFVLLKDSRAVKARYLMPIEPMIAYLGLAGLAWVVARFGRHAARPDRSRAPLLAVTVLAGLMIAVSLPRVALTAFHLGYHGRTSRFHQVASKGEYEDLFIVADLAARNCPAGRTVAADAELLSKLHLLADRLIVQLPGTGLREPAQTAAIHKFLAASDSVGCVVLDLSKANKTPAQRALVLEAFENPPNRQFGLKRLYAGRNCAIYQLTR